MSVIDIEEEEVSVASPFCISIFSAGVTCFSLVSLYQFNMKSSTKKDNSKKKEVRGDERFAAVGYDPRFQRFPKAKSKVKVDDRFKGTCV